MTLYHDVTEIVTKLTLQDYSILSPFQSKFLATPVCQAIMRSS